MLVELHVRELGVIADVDIVLAPGLTAVTGETGAGKTLVVGAIELLLGGRADPALVRAGAGEALVEGRFVDAEGRETVLARHVPANGRSRSFVDGAMATASGLAEAGRVLVDLYGQHEHQALLAPAAQRQAVDRFAGIDLGQVHALRRRAAGLGAKISSLGGDERTRARELDLLRYELAEIDALGISSPSEDEELAEEEEMLAGAAARRAGLERARDLLVGDASPGAADLVGESLGALEEHGSLAWLAARVRSALADLDDAATEMRRAAEQIEEDPGRLDEVRERRRQLRSLVRKHGDVLADVLAFAEQTRARVADLEQVDEARSALEAELGLVGQELERAERRVGDERRRAAPLLASAVAGHFSDLALGHARLAVEVPATGIGDGVEIMLAANPGEPFRPLARAASGGELARTMLALRLVLTTVQPTLVFDEVDAGIGGTAALAVGRALAELARERQVLVVTHLAQVAAYADQQITVSKTELGGRTVTTVRPVEGEERVAELSRMLSGHPDSSAARRHAAELLSLALAGRG